MKNIIITDATLRDGSHAIKHKITLDNIEQYTSMIDNTGVDIVSVGHGNGLGASSLQLGRCLCSDKDMIRTARRCLKKTKLCVLIIPGIGCIDRDLKMSIDEGVDVIRVASHCKEADTTKNHIVYAINNNCQVYGVLMMSHMISAQELVEEALKMEDYGVQGVVIMDSAGSYLMRDVQERISILNDKLNIAVGFHGHNNMGLAIANSLVAIDAGASIIDATICGFGAGAGNTQLEALVAVIKKSGYELNIDLDQLLDIAEIVSQSFVKNYPYSSPINISSGLNGVFSGFAPHVIKIAKDFHVDPKKDTI